MAVQIVARYPGCDAPLAWLEAHHLVHWAADGPTSLDNFVLVCGEHHHDQHEGGVVLACDVATRRWTVHQPDGTRIVAGPAPDGYRQPLHAPTGSDPPSPSATTAADTRGRYDPIGPGRSPPRRHPRHRRTHPTPR